MHCIYVISFLIMSVGCQTTKGQTSETVQLETVTPDHEFLITKGSKLLGNGRIQDPNTIFKIEHLPTEKPTFRLRAFFSNKHVCTKKGGTFNVRKLRGNSPKCTFRKETYKKDPRYSWFISNYNNKYLNRESEFVHYSMLKINKINYTVLGEACDQQYEQDWPTPVGPPGLPPH